MPKIEFRTIYSSRVPAIPAPAGSEFEDKREFETLPDGSRNLVIVGQVNSYEIIQASLEQSKIENILRRFNAGDKSAINVVQGSYLDVSGLPTSLAEMQSLVMRARDGFDQLPLEVRRTYDFDASRFVADYGSENWQSVMGLKKDPPAAPPAAPRDGE